MVRDDSDRRPGPTIFRLVQEGVEPVEPTPGGPGPSATPEPTPTDQPPTVTPSPEPPTATPEPSFYWLYLPWLLNEAGG